MLITNTPILIMLPIHKLRFRTDEDINPLHDLATLDTKTYDGLIFRRSFNIVNRTQQIYRLGHCICKIVFPIPYQTFNFVINDQITTINTDSAGEYVFPEFILVFLARLRAHIRIDVENDVPSVFIDYAFIHDSIKKKYTTSEYISDCFHPSNMYKICYSEGILSTQHTLRDVYIDISDMIKTNRINAKLLYKILYIDKSFEPTEENLPSSMFKDENNKSKHKLYISLDRIVDRIKGSPSIFNEILSQFLLKDINNIVVSYLDIIDILPDAHIEL